MYIIMSSTTPEITGDEALKLAQQATSSTPAVAETPAPEPVVKPEVVAPEPNKEDTAPQVNQEASISITKEEFAELNKTISELKASLTKAPEKQSIQETMSQSNQIVKEIREAGANHFQDAVNTPSATPSDIEITPESARNIIGKVVAYNFLKEEKGQNFAEAQFGDDIMGEFQYFQKKLGRDIILSTYLGYEYPAPFQDMIDNPALNPEDSLHLLYQNKSYVQLRTVEDRQASLSEQKYTPAEGKVLTIPPAEAIQGNFEILMSVFQGLYHNKQLNLNSSKELFLNTVMQGLNTMSVNIQKSKSLNAMFDMDLVGGDANTKFLYGMWNDNEYTHLENSFLPVIGITGKKYLNEQVTFQYKRLNIDGGRLIPDDVMKNPYLMNLGIRPYAGFTTVAGTEYDLSELSTPDSALFERFLKQMKNLIGGLLKDSNRQFLKAGNAKLIIELGNTVYSYLTQFATIYGETNSRVYTSLEQMLRVMYPNANFEIREQEALDRPEFDNTFTEGQVIGVAYYEKSYLVPSYTPEKDLWFDRYDSGRMPNLLPSSVGGMSVASYHHHDNIRDRSGAVQIIGEELALGFPMPFKQIVLINGSAPAF